MIFLCYPKCTTCQKAKKWLDDHQIAYDLRDVKLDNPTAEELTAWHERSGLSQVRRYARERKNPGAYLITIHPGTKSSVSMIPRYHPRCLSNKRPLSSPDNVGNPYSPQRRSPFEL